MAYPSIISTLSNPNPTDRLNSPSHSGLHQNENTAITEIETFVGTLSSTIGTLVYDIRAANSNGGGHVQAAITGGTGQTTYNKGDILAAQSSSVLTKIAVGPDQAVLIADSSQATGIRWGATPTLNVQSFLSTSIWVKPAAALPTSKILIELWGGGGSGAAAQSSNGAGGGGGGAYVSGLYNASILASSVLIAVGQGGASVIAISAGNQGTPTVFDPINSILGAGAGGGGGTTTAANGGGGGGGGQGSNVPNNGNNGTGTTGGQGGLILYAGLGQGTGGDVGAAGSIAAYTGAISGGGGGGAAGRAGGFSNLGGGGGGGVHASALGQSGNSGGGGKGGLGSIVSTGAAALPGGFPGGGGGGTYGTNAIGAAGGAGFAIVTTFL